MVPSGPLETYHDIFVYHTGSQLGVTESKVLLCWRRDALGVLAPYSKWLGSPASMILVSLPSAPGLLCVTILNSFSLLLIRVFRNKRTIYLEIEALHLPYSGFLF